MTAASRPAGAGPAPEVSIVIPTRDEAANVGPLLARLGAALAGVSHELVVVDDSDDDTPAVLARADAHGLVVRHRSPGGRAGGLSTAVVAGLRLARGRYTCVMDADLQHPPELIPTLLAAARGGADVAVASRYLREGSTSGLAGAGRRAVSRVAGQLARVLFTEARASTDPLSGFFLCRRDLVQGLELRPVGFKILLELLVCSPPLRVADVPLRFAPRLAGHSKASLHQGRLYLRHLRSLVRDVPGSARRWKFAAVGLVGLGIFVAILACGTVVLGWAPLPAWALAFAVSVDFTFLANRRLTFADMRRDRDREWTRYPVNAAITGLVQLVAFVALLATGWSVVAVGVLAAVVGMVANGALNQRLVVSRSRSVLPSPDRPAAAPDGSPAVRAPAAADGAAMAPEAQAMARAALDELLAIARAGDGALVRVRGATASPVVAELGWRDRSLAGTLPVPPDVMERAVRLQRAAVWTEAPSSRPQRRSSIAVHSALVVPVARGSDQHLVVALTRDAPHPFDGADLAAVLMAVDHRRAALVPGGWDVAHRSGRLNAARWRRRPGQRGPAAHDLEPGSQRAP
ncbi:MAG TPA: glycosyltransferase [Candidatus Micrarchaeia archaeon]|nr:glycosyltransferase [Candidatus Micrarchaeia archaeon]